MISIKKDESFLHNSSDVIGLFQIEIIMEITWN